jgi:hypothetical protein
VLTITNILQATAGGLENLVGAYKKNRIFILASVTHKFWFSCFMGGMHKRVGQVRKHDRVLTVNIMQAVDRILESVWENAANAEEQKRSAEMGVLFIGGFCTGLRGKEMLQIKLVGTANSLVHLNDAKNAHFMFVILERTKSDQSSGASQVWSPLLPSYGGDAFEAWAMSEEAGGSHTWQRLSYGEIVQSTSQNWKMFFHSVGKGPSRY